MWHYNYNEQTELYHYGVPGMKWGKRKAQPSSDGVYNTHQRALEAKKKMLRAKDDRAAANKAYSKAYNRYDAKAIGGLSPSKAHRKANDERFNEVVDRAKKADAADKAYKREKAAYKELKKIDKMTYKQAKKQRAKEIQAGESALGKIWNAYTGAHKIQAKIAVDEERKRSK